VNQTVESEGRSALNSELAAAHRKSREEARHNAGLNAFLSARFLEGVRDWDQIVAHYLSISDDAARIDSWRDETINFLQEKGYDEPLIHEYVRCVEKYSDFLQRYSFIY
jgi:hypothetical protein